MLKVLDNIFYQKLTREAILPPADIKNIFTNLGDIVQLHGTCTHGHKRTHRHVYACTHTYTHRMTLLHSLSFFSFDIWANGNNSEKERDVRNRPNRRRLAVLGEYSSYFFYFEAFSPMEYDLCNNCVVGEKCLSRSLTIHKSGAIAWNSFSLQNKLPLFVVVWDCLSF